MKQLPLLKWDMMWNRWYDVIWNLIMVLWYLPKLISLLYYIWSIINKYKINHHHIISHFQSHFHLQGPSRTTLRTDIPTNHSLHWKLRWDGWWDGRWWDGKVQITSTITSPITINHSSPISPITINPMISVEWRVVDYNEMMRW